MTVQRSIPALTKRCFYESSSGRSARRLGAIVKRSQRDTQPARTFATPRTCMIVKNQPLRISRHPIIRIRAPSLGSRPPLCQLTLWSGDILCPRIRILSPKYWGATLASNMNARAVFIMESTSKT